MTAREAYDRLCKAAGDKLYSTSFTEGSSYIIVLEGRPESVNHKDEIFVGCCDEIGVWEYWLEEGKGKPWKSRALWSVEEERWVK